MKWRMVLVAIAIAGCDKTHPGGQEPRAPIFDAAVADAPPVADALPARPSMDAGAMDAGAGDAAAASAAPVEVTWDLRRAGGSLRIHYTVRNASSQPIALLDRLVAGGVDPQAAFDRVVVRDGDAPDTVSFARGNLAGPPGVGVAIANPPAARVLSPGRSVSADAIVPLPLAGWYPSGPWRLRGAPTRAYLEIGYVVGPVALTDESLADGTVIQTVVWDAHTGRQQFARSETRALP